MTSYSRRRVLNLVAGAPLAFTAACTTLDEKPDTKAKKPTKPRVRMPFGPEPKFPSYAEMYGPMSDGGFNLPAIPYQKIEPQFLRQVVRDTTREEPGTIVVDTRAHFLYLVLGNGNAIRYGVGLGKAGFEWSGRAVVQWKQAWPRWKPPAEMIERRPDLEKYSVENGGMEPGLTNPLGARALYIFQNGEDTLYRLHGSPEWNSIGKSVSSGCVRLMNQDVIDLYSRVRGRTPIVVR